MEYIHRLLLIRYIPVEFILFFAANKMVIKAYVAYIPFLSNSVTLIISKFKAYFEDQEHGHHSGAY